MVLAWAAALVFVDWRSFDERAAAIFAAVGCIFPVVVSILAVRSNEKLGPAVAGAAGNVTPLFAILFAVLFPGERLGLVQLLGLALVAPLVALFPLMAVVLSYLFLRDEPLHAIGLLGILTSVAGVILLLVEPEEPKGGRKAAE